MNNKLHHKQTLFHGDNSRNRWIFGGNRTGKTHAGAMEAVRRAINGKENGEGSEGWVVSLSTQVQRDVAQRKILEMLDTEKAFERIADYECVMLSGKQGSASRGVIDFITIKRHCGGDSRIGFKNCEQGREKFQGTALDWVWFDEEPSEDIYDECLLRTLDKGGVIWGTMTPLKGRTWVYDRIYMKAGKQSGISVHEWSWEDNPYLDAKEIKRMERSLSAETLESRKHGRFMDGLGLVFKEFSEKNICSKMVWFPEIDKKVCYTVSRTVQQNSFCYTGISIDPGYTNPTAVLWFAIDHDENIFCTREYKESHQSIEQIAKTIFRISEEEGVAVENVFIDSAATAVTLGTPASVAEQFRALGIPVNTYVDKSVLEGIHKVKGLFCSAEGERKLFIGENCIETIKEIRSYYWGDNNRPIKSNDHCLDALRYFCMADHRNLNKPKTKQNRLDKFKRRIITCIN